MPSLQEPLRLPGEPIPLPQEHIAVLQEPTPALQAPNPYNSIEDFGHELLQMTLEMQLHVSSAALLQLVSFVRSGAYIREETLKMPVALPPNATPDGLSQVISWL